MPNWCSNSVTIKHNSRDKIKASVEAFESSKFLNHFSPLPNGEWNYQWCVENWGTKWDVGSDSGEAEILDSNQAHFNFDSAWSPPIEVYKKMCSLGFEVTAYYYEPGVGFVGKFIGNANNVFDDCYDLADLDSTDVRDEIGEELDEYWGISESMSLDEDQDLVDELDRLQDELDEISDVERAKNLPPHTD